jgi:hypothetical protein
VPYFTAVKWAAIVGLLAFVYHAGGNGPRAALERDHAAMAEAATQALLAQRSAQEAEATRINKAVTDYENAPLDPIAPTIARRLYIAAAGGCAVPSSPTVASGTQAPAAQPLGPAGVERALGGLIEACAEDARQMNAMLELAP